MDKDNRPHSREKKIGGGFANVEKKRRISGGEGPVGFGGRKESRSDGRSYQNVSIGRSSKGIALNFKSILILIVLAAVVLLALKFMGGGSGISMGDIGEWNSPGSNYQNTGNQWQNSISSTQDSSYTNPDYSVSSLAREKFYIPAEGDDVTVMVYMCGTDLESKYGMATKDINEMINADISDKVNLIVETGGCKKWQNNMFSNSKNQIYKIKHNNIDEVEADFGNDSMTNPDNLAKFIKYCAKNYPAERNILIFWDHGGGSVSGYGYDEKDKNPSSMTLSKINSALEKAGCHFDFIGFDACLMATLENDLVCNNYADYLIASEETEPGTGWYYTNWLTELSENPTISTVDLSKTIIDDFVSSCCSQSRNAQVTLSLVDLSELDGTVPDALRDFASSTSALISSGDYKQVSDARAGTRQFSSQNKLNQIDLIDLAERLGTVESGNLAKALRGCVKYNRTTISRSNGISIYFPYETTKTVKSAIASYNDIGENENYSECIDEYTKCIQSFASLEYGGQVTAFATQNTASYGTGYDWSDLLGTLVSSSAQSTASTSPISVLTGSFGSGSSYSSGSAGYPIDASTILSLLGAFDGRSMPAEYDWVDTGLISEKAAAISAKFIDPSRITATEKDGHSVLDLTDDEWELIQTAELNVFVNDGNGYIDLGLDNTFEWLDDSSMLLEYDGTWLTLNNNVCAYYLVSDTKQSDGSWVTVGRIPALLNGEFVNIQVVFDDDNPYGTITGAYPMYEESGIEVQPKGNIEIVAGDTIELLCDYYDLDGNYSASYTLSDPFTVPASGLSLINLRINTEDVSVTYRLTDIYGNHFWVPVI